MGEHLARLIEIANAALNIAAGLVLGLGYDRWTSGIITAASGELLGEATILTQPTGLASPSLRYTALPAPRMAGAYGTRRRSPQESGVMLAFSF